MTVDQTRSLAIQNMATPQSVNNFQLESVRQKIQVGLNFRMRCIPDSIRIKCRANNRSKNQKVLNG